MDQEEIGALAQSVYEFKEALKRLTGIISSEQELPKKEVQSTAHECLSDVLRILKHLLEKYPGLQTTEMLLKAQKLVYQVQGYTSGNQDSKDLYDFINQLATSFSIGLSEYLMGDSDINIHHMADDGMNSQVVKDVMPNVKKINVQKMTTFGVELERQLQMSGTKVPHIVSKCIEEIDQRGILVKGIYRVSGVKSKVEKLCQEFEADGENVKLTGIHPNIIANVLKLYLRQLPQPLFTYHLYPEFVRFAKNWPCNLQKQPVRAIEELRKILSKLPKHYYCTVKVIIEHLKRVSSHDEINNMSPSNLGIVFGPTLLRTTYGHSSISSLLDTVHQSRAIELIITFADQLFMAGV